MLQFTDPCLHEDTEYSIRVYKHSEIVRETLSSSLNEEFTLQLEVDQGLTVGESYTVVATGSNIAGSPQLTDFIRKYTQAISMKRKIIYSFHF